MNGLGYVVMGFGALLAIIGIVLFAKKGAQGNSTVKMFQFEFQLGGSALVVFVLGVLVFLVPFIYPDSFTKQEDASSGSTQPTEKVGDGGQSNPQLQTSSGTKSLSGLIKTKNKTVPTPASLTPDSDQDLIAQRVHQIIARQLRIALNRVSDDATYSELGADSLDGVELIMGIEDEFKITIPDANAERLLKSKISATVFYVSSRVSTQQTPK